MDTKDRTVLDVLFCAVLFGLSLPLGTVKNSVSCEKQLGQFITRIELQVFVKRELCAFELQLG